MIPLSDVNPTRRFPIVNSILIALNILAFLYELSLGEQIDPFITTWGVRSTEVMALLRGQLGLLVPLLLQSLVSMFLHGGWLHIGGNMLFLWIFGDNVEDNFGSVPYLLFYLLCGFGSVIGQALLTPDSPAPSIGASGAISGVLAAYLVMFPAASVRALLFIVIVFFVRLPAWSVIVLWFATQLLNGLASVTDAAQMSGGVAYGAHIGGFVLGLVLTAAFRKPDRPPRYSYDERRGWS